MKLTTQEQMERVLQAVELLTGYNLADIEKLRRDHPPETIFLPMREFTLLGMGVRFIPRDIAITISPNINLHHPRPTQK